MFNVDFLLYETVFFKHTGLPLLCHAILREIPHPAPPCNTPQMASIIHPEVTHMAMGLNDRCFMQVFFISSCAVTVWDVNTTLFKLTCLRSYTTHFRSLIAGLHITAEHIIKHILSLVGEDIWKNKKIHPCMPSRSRATQNTVSCITPFLSASTSAVL